jgi:hypothetical protein
LDLTKNQASTQVDEQPDTEAQTNGEQPTGLTPASETSQAEVSNKSVQPSQEPPKTAEAPAIPSGIQTPRGPITRSPIPLSESQPGPFKPQTGQTRKQRIGL